VLNPLLIFSLSSSFLFFLLGVYFLAALKLSEISDLSSRSSSMTSFNGSFNLFPITCFSIFFTYTIVVDFLFEGVENRLALVRGI